MGEANAPDRASEVDHEFGRLLFRRRGWTMAFVLSVLGALAVAGAAIGGPMASGQAPGKGWTAGVLGWLMLVLGCLWWFRPRRCSFFERGVRVSRWGATARSLAYANSESLTFAITREYCSGMHAGTSMLVKLVGQGTRVRYCGRYKEKSSFFGGTIFDKSFKTTDEDANAVRSLIAEHVADHHQARLTDAHEPFNWARRATLSLAGVTPRRGRKKGQLVPFAQISAAKFKDGSLHLFVGGEKRAFLTLEINAENFWPGLVMLERLHSVTVEQQVPDARRAA